MVTHKKAKLRVQLLHLVIRQRQSDGGYSFKFRDQFIANFMTAFSDESRAAELAAFAPAQATSGGRVMAGRAQEVIAISADLKSRALPAVEAWIRARK